jgi:hypothetical protein
VKFLSLTELRSVPFPDKVKNAIIESLNDLIAVAVVGDPPKAVGFQEMPNDWPAGTVSVWLKGLDPSDNTLSVPPDESKTKHALEMVDVLGLSPAEAAREVGIHRSAVTRAIQRRKNKPICPSCKQVIRRHTPV